MKEVEIIKITVEIMEKGGIILYPTDTVWGLGCDATNAEAVEKISRLKGRGKEHSYIILLADAAQIRNYAAHVPAEALTLIKQTERPLTIIYENGRNLAPAVMAANGSVAIRVTNDPFCRQLVMDLGKPIVSTSANISREPPAPDLKSISETIKLGVDFIANPSDHKPASDKPSKIVKISGDEIVVIRE